MRLALAFGAALLAVGLGCAPALADGGTVYNDLSGSEIVALLDAHGYQATLTTDGDGDPMIMGRADGLNFRVQTYDCNEQAPRRCRSLQFVASFALQHKATTDDFEAMNEYNQKKVYGRAFIDENGDAAIDMVVNLAGGVMAANLMDQVGTWKTYVLDVFVEHLGWKVS
jgi:hypothetical protein